MSPTSPCPKCHRRPSVVRVEGDLHAAFCPSCNRDGAFEVGPTFGREETVNAWNDLAARAAEEMAEERAEMALARTLPAPAEAAVAS